MKVTDINLRDPFVLYEKGHYYLYGTRGQTAFTKNADGFDVYTSRNLVDWEGPTECFHRPDGFWATRNFWAPEVHVYEGAYYMFATFADSGKRLGTAILRANSPMGPFAPWSEGTITPEDWRCLDGTFHVEEDGSPYMIFSREWKQVHDGQICAVALSKDLRRAVGESFVLFTASQGRPLVRPFLLRNYVTDGPYAFRSEGGKLHLLWSSFGKKGYVQLVAHSDTNTLRGNWSIRQQPLYLNDGGHGMIFRDGEGNRILTLHTPNRSLKERPIFLPLTERDGELEVKKNLS